jgi:transposase InsO family protein
MRETGLRARAGALYRANPRLHHFYRRHPNRVGARRARRPNQIWVGDITYIRVARQWRFLAVILDQCSRRVLAWAIRATRDAGLTRAVLDAAWRRRRPRRGLIFHSDRGSEYAAERFHDRLRVCGIRQSAGRVGRPGDNAHVESFFHSLRAELLHGVQFTTDAQLRLAVARYIRYYNQHRRHSALQYLSPMAYESRTA